MPNSIHIGPKHMGFLSQKYAKKIQALFSNAQHDLSACSPNQRCCAGRGVCGPTCRGSWRPSMMGRGPPSRWRGRRCRTRPGSGGWGSRGGAASGQRGGGVLETNSLLKRRPEWPRACKNPLDALLRRRRRISAVFGGIYCLFFS